jgi:hypothetical protein
VTAPLFWDLARFGFVSPPERYSGPFATIWTVEKASPLVYVRVDPGWAHKPGFADLFACFSGGWTGRQTP